MFLIQSSVVKFVLRIYILLTVEFTRVEIMGGKTVSTKRNFLFHFIIRLLNFIRISRIAGFDYSHKTNFFAIHEGDLKGEYFVTTKCFYFLFIPIYPLKSMIKSEEEDREENKERLMVRTTSCILKNSTGRIRLIQSFLKLTFLQILHALSVQV